MNEIRIFAKLASALLSVIITAAAGLLFEYGHLV